MTQITLKDARNILEVVIGPEDIAAKIPEFKFEGEKGLLKANGLTAAPPLPSKEVLETARDQKKALIFRVGKDGQGKPIHLIDLKERFGGLIYSSWYVKPPLPFAQEPIQTGWALADLEPMPETAEKTYEEQTAYVKEHKLRLKSPAADAYDLIAAFKVTGKYHRSTPLNGRTAAVFHEEPVKISHFEKSGMAVSTGWGKTVRSPEIGAATELVTA